MPKLVIHSRQGIEAHAFTQPSIAICIAYPTGRLHKINRESPLLLDVLHVRFSDCDGEGRFTFPEGKNDVTIASLFPMTRGNAVDILDFVMKWKDKVEEIHVACFGGVSRSRGVAAGLAAVHGWDDEHIYAEGMPNAWCKTLIIREAYNQSRT